MNIIRNRTAFYLVGLLILGTLLGMVHNRSLDAGRPFPPREVVRLVLTPVNIVARNVFVLGEWFVRAFRPRRSVLRENAMLRREVRRLTEENARLAEAAEENVRLRQALGLKRNLPLRTISARVISREESSWFNTAVIDRGSRVGVEPGAAVVNFRGLVGQVIEADLFSSQVVALTDSESRVGAMVRRSRSSGILLGQGSDYLALSYLPKDADVRKTDIVVTSGMGQVIPKGFVVGRVVRVVRNASAGGTTALVRPSVRLDEIEDVLVVKQGGERCRSIVCAPASLDCGASAPLSEQLSRAGAW